MGLRAKDTKWLSRKEVFASLQGECPGISSSHKHLPYGAQKSGGGWHFDTSAEGAYPDLLCAQVVQCVVSRLGLRAPASTRASDPVAQSRKSRQLISEFKCIRKVDPDKLPTQPHKILSANSRSVDRGSSQTSASSSATASQTSASSSATASQAIEVGILKMLTTLSEELVQMRAEFIKKVLSRRSKLEKEEKAIHEAMPPHM